MLPDGPKQLFFLDVETTPRPPAERPKKLTRIEYMHDKFGFDGHKACGDCRHLTSRMGANPNKRYFKCLLYGVTRGAGSDWRKKWVACGKWEESK